MLRMLKPHASRRAGLSENSREWQRENWWPGAGIEPAARRLSVRRTATATDPGDRDTEITWGIGAQYDFAGNIGVRAQWQRYETDPDEVDLLSVSVLFRF